MIETAGASVFRHPVIRDVEAADADALAAELIERYRAAKLVLSSAREGLGARAEGDLP